MSWAHFVDSVAFHSKLLVEELVHISKKKKLPTNCWLLPHQKHERKLLFLLDRDISNYGMTVIRSSGSKTFLVSQNSAKNVGIYVYFGLNLILNYKM